MSEIRVYELQKNLIARRRALLKLEPENVKEGLQDLTPDATDELSHVRTHPADLGSDESQREVMLRLADGERREIQEIDEALKRMQNGTYGICEECGVQIPISRLVAIPHTRFCASCASQNEKWQKEQSHRTRASDYTVTQ